MILVVGMDALKLAAQAEGNALQETMEIPGRVANSVTTWNTERSKGKRMLRGREDTFLADPAVWERKGGELWQRQSLRQ